MSQILSDKEQHKIVIFLLILVKYFVTNVIHFIVGSTLNTAKIPNSTHILVCWFSLNN